MLGLRHAGRSALPVVFRGGLLGFQNTCRGLKTLDDDGRVISHLNLKPVIRIPVRVQQKALKRVAKVRSSRFVMDRFEGDRTLPPVIQCRRSELDHYQRQTYSKVDQIRLASEEWNSRSTRGDYFTFQDFEKDRGGRPFRFGHRHEDPANFESLAPLDQRLAESLRSCGYRKPTYIQCLAIPKLLIERESSVIAAETGNGKTLAFLVPVIQQTIQLKEVIPSEKRAYNSPLAVIVTPGKELSRQVFNVAQDLAGSCGLSVTLEDGTKSEGVKLKVLRSPRKEVDILIGTFGSLHRLFEERLYLTDFVHHVVFDEADTLLDDTFNHESVPFLGKMGLASKKAARKKIGEATQITLVGATFPTNLNPILQEICSPDALVRISTNRLHRVPSHIRQKFIRVTRSSKPDLLLDIMAEDVAKSRKVLIFSNKASTAGFLVHHLRENGVACVPFYKSLGEDRSKNLDAFLGGSDDVNVMSCTDLCSRGIDTSRVFHVINYDFPLNLSDYVHRVGRVGRVGSPQGSKVTSFVNGRLQISLVQKLETSVRTHTEIPGVNNNIIRIIKNMRQTKMERELLKKQNTKRAKNL